MLASEQQHYHNKQIIADTFSNSSDKPQDKGSTRIKLQKKLIWRLSKLCILKVYYTVAFVWQRLQSLTIDFSIYLWVYPFTQSSNRDDLGFTTENSGLSAKQGTYQSEGREELWNINAFCFISSFLTVLNCKDCYYKGCYWDRVNRAMFHLETSSSLVWPSRIWTGSECYCWKELNDTEQGTRSLHRSYNILEKIYI